MSEPLVVILPHRLGKAEAKARIASGFARAKGEFSHLIRIDEDTWEGDRLTFAASALGQHAQGTLDVYEAGVRLEVRLRLPARALCARGAARGGAQGAGVVGEEVRVAKRQLRRRHPRAKGARRKLRA